jgi:aromatic ring-cleaving dioxygenase
LIARIKQQKGARWDLTLGAWHMPPIHPIIKYFFKIKEESTKLPSTEGKVINRKI